MRLSPATEETRKRVEIKVDECMWPARSEVGGDKMFKINAEVSLKSVGSYYER